MIDSNKFTPELYTQLFKSTQTLVQSVIDSPKGQTAELPQTLCAALDGLVDAFYQEGIPPEMMLCAFQQHINDAINRISRQK